MTSLSSLRAQIAELGRRVHRPAPNLTTGEMRDRLCDLLGIAPADLAEHHEEIFATLRLDAAQRGLRASS